MKKNIVLINLAGALIWMSMYAYVPTLPAYAYSLNATAITVGFIGGAYGIAQLILRIPLGVLSDKINKDKLLLIIGFGVLALSNVLFIFADTPIKVVLARGVAGAAAAWWVIICVTYSKYFSDEKQVKAQGVLSASSSVGKLLAAILGGLTAQFFGLSAPFVFSLIVALVGLLFMTQLKEIKTPSQAIINKKDIVNLFKNKQLWGFSILSILSQFLCFAIPTTFSMVAAKELGADSLSLGALNFVYFLVVACVSLIAGTKFYNKIGGKNMLAISFLFGAISCIPFFYHINVSTIFIVQVFSGICYGITQAVLAGYVLKCVAKNARSTATGIYQSLFAIGIFAGPMLFGALYEGINFDFALYVFLAITLIAVLLSYLLIPKAYNRD